jgi:hypothetical protein
MEDAMSDDHRQKILDELGAKLQARRVVLDQLADAAAHLEAAQAAYRNAYKAAVEAGWDSAELAKAGVREPDKRGARRRAPRRPAEPTSEG